jgi:Flp pilus assembly protein TadD
LAAATSLVTYVVHQQAGATASLGIFPLALRFENALVSYAVYIVKMLWPGNLAVFYPYPRHSLAVPALFAGLGLLAITVAAMRTAARRPYLIVGWLWYLVTLAPVIGLIQVGAQARADRYTYIPMIGLSIALVWGLAEIVRPWPKVQAGLAWTACVVCVLLTWSQVRYWRDGVSLFRHAVDVTTDNYVARFNLASALDERGESAEAARELAEAVRIRPDFAVARAELGQLLAKQGQFPEALLQLNEARRLNPSDASIHFRLGTVLGAAGRESEAGAEFLESVRLDSGNADAHYNLGIALANQSRISEASNEFAAAVRLRPDDAYFRFNLGVTLARLGQIDEAIAQLSEAVRIDARLPGAREALDDAIALRRARGK